MIDLQTLTNSERAALAVDFLNRFDGVEEISRDNFDLAIIDMGLADDPGTDDTKAIAHKGFVQQRNNARRSLNNYAGKLPDGQAYSLEVERDKPGVVFLRRWEDATAAEAADIGNRVEKYTKNKVKRVGKLRADVVGKVAEGAELDSLMQMIGMVEGHGLIMQRNIRAEVAKFNRAVAMVERQAEALSIGNDLADAS
jgi:hypothetical protein